MSNTTNTPTRSPLRLTRAITIYGPLKRADGTRLRSQPLVKGLFVRADNARSLYVPTPYPTFDERPVTRTSKVCGLYYVSDISPDGRIVELQPVWVTPYSYAPTVLADGTLEMPTEYERNPLTGKYEHREISESLVRNRLVRGLESSRRYVRPAAIKAIVDIDKLPQSFLLACRNLVRATAVDSLNTRLTQAENTRSPWRVTIRSQWHYTPRNRRIRVDLGRKAAVVVATCRKQINQGTPTIDAVAVAVQELKRQGLHSVAEKLTERYGLVQRGCGHFDHATNPEVMAQGRYGYTTVCPVCAAHAVMALDRAGTPVPVMPGVTVHTWSDGTRRTTPEPAIIGTRHSGKGVVGFVPPLVPRTAGTYLTLGIELEMQSVTVAHRDNMARILRKTLAASNLLDTPTMKKYLHFEEDGSTGAGGFEMVTGYTDLPTQEALLQVLLGGEGAAPWAGKLRSHDAVGASCGLHVHVTKPTSPIHAAKLRYFVHSTAMKPMIEALARRYNNAFAQFNPNGEAVNPPDKSAVDAFKGAKSWYDLSIKARATRSIHRLSAGTRYVALNFQNTATVEYRMFRGSMVFTTVAACLEFTQASWLFSKDTTSVQLTPDNFLTWINDPTNAKETKYLRAYLARKGFQARVAKPKKTPAPAATTTVADETNA